MMSQSTQPDVFRRKLEEARKAEEAKAFPMTFAGFPCRVRPLPRLHFIRAGRMPEYLTRKIVAAVDKDATPPKETAADTVAGEVFMRQAVCAVLVEPRAVEAEPVPEGGYLYAELEEAAPDFVLAVYAWVMKDCPMPPEEKGEEVLGVADLETFPDSAGGQPSANAGAAREGGGVQAGGTNAARRKRASRK